MRKRLPNISYISRYAVRSRFLNYVVFLIVFFSMVITASYLANLSIYPISKELMPYIDPSVKIVQLNLTLVEIIAICVLICSFFLISLRYIVPPLHNFVYGSVGAVPLTYAFPIVFAAALPFMVALAYDAEKHTLTHFVDNNPAWFALFALILSFAGLFFSAAAMQDLRHVINTFEEFADRFAAMLKEIKSDSDYSNYVRIMAYTPLPGALALSPTKYDMLKKLIHDKDTRVEVTCLYECCIKRWMEGFEGKKLRGGGPFGERKLSGKDIKTALADVEKLLVNLRNPDFKGPFAEDEEHREARCPMADMPRFYAYFTNSRAIVINPLYFPFDTLPAQQQPAELRDRCVELIGFETTDSHTLENLHTTYRFLRRRFLEPTPKANAA
jgi:hypothetical protein